MSIRCVQITRYVWRAWCAATIQITHPHCHNSMQMACGSAEREKRGEEKGEGSSLIPAIAHPAGTYHLIPSPSLLPSPSSSLSFTPSTHTHTITSTGLADNRHHVTAPLTQPASPHTHAHTHVPSLTQCMCQCTEETQQQQQPHCSCSSPPPAAHVLLHLHATPAHTSSKWYMCE